MHGRDSASLVELDLWSIMRGHLPGAYLTMFLLFFGFALLDAIRTRDWLGTALWLAFGALFVWADMRNRSSSRVMHRPWGGRP